MGRSVLISSLDSDKIQGLGMSLKLFFLLFGILAILVLADADHEGKKRSLSNGRGQNLVKARKTDKRKSQNNGSGAKERKSVKGKKMKKRGRKAEKNNKKKKSPSRRRKGGKRSGKGKIKGKGRSSRQNTVSDECLSQAVKMMKIWKDVVRNFEAQSKRIKKHNTTGGNKADKKGIFGPIARRLVEIGGGNKSNMSCGGEFQNDGAKQLANLTETLFECEKEVNGSCHTDNFPQPNMTFINNCDALVETFKTAAQECLNKTITAEYSEACTCWSGSALAAIAAEVKTCKASDQATSITAQLRKCTKAFGKCRKFEDDAITSIMSCKEDQNKLKEKASALQKNKNIVEEAKSKMSSLKASRRNKREVAISCSQIIVKSQQMTTIISQFPSSPMVIMVATEITTSIVTVCTSDEIGQIQDEVNNLTEALEEIEEALEALQEQIEALTGTTASATELESFTTVMVTKAPGSGRFRRSVRFEN